MDIKVECPPDAFWGPNVPTVNILLYFVVLIFESSPIRAFVNIFETVLDCSKRRNALNIYVGMIFGREIGVVWHYPAVIYMDRPNTAYRDRERSPIVGTCVQRITIIICGRNVLECLRIALCTVTVLHAWRGRIYVTAWPVNHGGLHSLEEQGLCVRIGPLGRYTGIDVCRRA